MIFKDISESKFEKGDFLWRYIDMHKLIDLAINQKLHFNRTDKFSDLFEGVTRKLIVERYIAKSTISNPSIDKSIRERINRHNNQELERYEIESIEKQKTQFINCWIKSERESVAMWNLYSNRDSIALKANPRKLIDYFQADLSLKPEFYPSYEFICGSITYCRLNPIDVYENVPLPLYSAFKKDIAYDFEKEFRFLIATPMTEANTNPENIRIDITSNFINLLEIVCHPEMEEWKINNLKRLCKELKFPEPVKSKTEIRIQKI